jgi:hypothetical protein
MSRTDPAACGCLHAPPLFAAQWRKLRPRHPDRQASALSGVGCVLPLGMACAFQVGVAGSLPCRSSLIFRPGPRSYLQQISLSPHKLARLAEHTVNWQLCVIPPPLCHV